MITLYGIKNCDTVRKARKWLESQNVEYRFHDFRADGLDADRVREWICLVGIDMVVNRRGTTFRKLSDTDKSAIAGGDAIAVLCREPTLIKRPVLESEDAPLFGFDSEQYRSRLKLP